MLVASGGRPPVVSTGDGTGRSVDEGIVVDGVQEIRSRNKRRSLMHNPGNRFGMRFMSKSNTYCVKDFLIQPKKADVFV